MAAHPGRQIVSCPDHRPLAGNGVAPEGVERPFFLSILSNRSPVITMSYLGTARFEKILDREKFEKELVS